MAETPKDNEKVVDKATVDREQLDALKEKAEQAKTLEERLNSLEEKVSATKERELPEFLKNGTPEVYVRSDDHERRLQTNRKRLEFLLAAKNRDNRKITELYPDYSKTMAEYRGKANWNETTDAQGDYLIPQEWAAEIFTAVDDYGFAVRMARRIPMRRKTLNLQSQGTLSAAFVSEGAAATLEDSSNFYAQSSIDANLLKIAWLMTEEFQEDVDPYAIDALTQEASRALAAEIDRVFFKGATGSGDAFDGILNSVTTNVSYMGGTANSGNTAFSDISWTDLVPLVTGVKASRGNRYFVTSQTVYQNLRQETATSSDKTPIWGRTAPMGVTGAQIGLQGLEDSTYWTPLDVPMVVIPDDAWESSAADTAAVVYGDFSQHAVIGERKQVTTKVFNEYYNSTALSGQNSVVELSQRLAIAFPKEENFSLLKTAAS